MIVVQKIVNLFRIPIKAKRLARFIYCLPWSIIFNFYYLPFKQAVKLPILFQSIPTFIHLGGKVRIARGTPIKTGLIRLGVRFEPISSQTSFRWQNRGEVIFSGKCMLADHFYFCVFEGGVVKLGEDVRFNCHCSIMSKLSITIGNHSYFGWNTQLIDTDFHHVYDTIAKKVFPKNLPIVVGDNVWVANNCQIVKGARLPNRTLVMANSYVKSKFKKEYSLIGGNPAVFIDEGYTLWKL